MSAGSAETRELAHEIVGPARVIAFGTSIVAPSASVVTVLILMVAYAGFASPLVVLITFAASLCCAMSTGEFARHVPSAGWAYTYNSRGLAGNSTLVTLLPFIGLGWLCVGGVAAAVLRARHPAMFGRLGRTWTSS
jgi:amino acid transporter